MKTGRLHSGKNVLPILCAGVFAIARILSAQDEPLGNDGHEREELGVNSYTAPSIARIFEQLDVLKPGAAAPLKRDSPAATATTREQKGLVFGGLIAEGFLIVEAKRKDLVDEFGRVLLREAQGLGVADRVTRHSASLTELARRGDWASVRKELIATQADVEDAMIQLKDEKIAHLISLGGWLRGLEMSSRAVKAEFSPERAKILLQPDVANYFAAELRTLPPELVQVPLFQTIRTAVKSICLILNKPRLGVVDVDALVTETATVDSAIRSAK